MNRAPLALCLALLGGAASAQETYDLRDLYQPSPGDTWRLEVDDEVVDVVELIHDGHSTPERSLTTEEWSCDVEVVRADAHHVLEETRTYDAFTRRFGEDDAQTLGAPLRVHLFRDAPWPYRPAEGHTVPDVLVGHLESQSRAPRTWFLDMLPTHPVAEGEEWALDVEELAEQLGFDLERLDRAASFRAGVLVEVVQRDGYEVRRFEVTAQLIQPLSADGERMSGKTYVERFVFEVSPDGPCDAYEYHHSFHHQDMEEEHVEGFVTGLEGTRRWRQTPR